MIVYNPPLSLAFIPATQKLARISVDVMRSESAGAPPQLRYTLWDTNGGRISPDATALPNKGQIDAAGATAIAKAKAGLAGDTIDQVHSRACLAAIEAALGIKGGAVA